MTAAATRPEPPWWTPRKPGPGRRRALSREAIVAAALGVLRAEGIEAVSMRRVAAELDTGAASLYAHVAHKDELLELVYDEVVGEIPLPVPDPARWQEQVVQIWIDAHAALARNGDIARVALGRIPMGPNALRMAETIMSLLRAGGVPDRAAAWLVDVIGLYVSANAIEGAMFVDREGHDHGQYLDQVAKHLQALPVAAFPTTVALAPQMMTGTPQERFRFGLDLMVRGVAALVPPPHH